MLKLGSKFGFSFSWRRALGISGVKMRLARSTGIPTTRSGLERKVGALTIRILVTTVLLVFGILIAAFKNI